MQTQDEQLSLETLCQGAAVDRFNEALETIIENLLDPDTTDKKREITLKVTFGRTDDLTMSGIEFQVTPKYAPKKGGASQAFIGKDLSGKVSANEIKPPQKPLFPDVDNVTPIKEGIKK